MVVVLAARSSRQLLRLSVIEFDDTHVGQIMTPRPRLVTGSRENLKVTFPEDLAIAEAFLARRK